MLLDRYKQLVDTLYCEPKDEVIMGSFLTKTQQPLPIEARQHSVKIPAKKKARHNEADIRKFFLNTSGKQTSVMETTSAKKIFKKTIEIIDTDSE